MALHKLQVDDFYDDAFKLIAVHARIEDYRLAYLINKHLNIKLERKSQDIDFGYITNSFSIFEWYDHMQQMMWNMISNTCKKEEDVLYSAGSLFTDQQKVTKNFYLLEQFSQVDFFIKISEEVQYLNEVALIQKLNRIPQIVTSYQINAKDIKLKDHLIF